MEKLKGAMYLFLGLAVVAAIGLGIGLLIEGGARVSAAIFPWVLRIAGLVFVVTLFVLVPLSLFRGARGFASLALLLASYVMGFALWVWGFLLTYVLWGGWAVILGLFLFGVGVVPIAILATGLKGMWPVFWQLCVLLVIVIAARGYSYFVASRAE